MKKKILAVALAATMVVASAFSAFAATESSVTITDAFGANSGVETLSGDFDVTYTFHNVSDGATNNYENFILEMNNGNGVYIDVRADNYGWLANQTDGAELTFGDGAADWEAWLAEMVAGLDCTVNVVRSGNTFTVTSTMGDYTFTASTTCTDFDGCDVNIYLTGEKCTLTNIVFTDNTASSSSSDDEDETTTEAAADTEEETTTEAAAESSDETTTTAAATTETGDVATFASIAIVAAAAVAIVALRKRVTE